MALRTPEPPKGGPGNIDASKNRNSPGPAPGAKGAPALGSLAGDDDDEDDAPKPPRPIRMTSQMKAVSVPSPKPTPPPPTSTPPRPPSPPSQPAPPKPPAAPPKPAPSPPKPAPSPPKPVALPSLDEPLVGEATVMMAQPMIPEPASPALLNRPGEVALPGARGNPAPAHKPAPEPARPAAPPVGGMYANNEATQMMMTPSLEAPAVGSPQLGPGQMPGHSMEANNESTRISEGPIDFAAIARQMNMGGGGGGATASTGGGEASVIGEATQFGQPSKGKKKPVADVKARSKAVLAPIDPSRLLTQAEAAELKAAISGAASLDKFLESSSPQGGGSLADEPQHEATMIGRFFGAFGIGETKAAAAPVGKDPAQEAWEAVRKAPLLNGLNPQFVTDAIKSGDLKLVAMGRDMLLETDGRAVLLVEGQVALARFKPEVLDKERRAQRAYKPGDKKAEKKEYNRRQEAGPMIRLCESNLGLFNEGDLVSIEAQGQDAVGLAVYSVTPIRALSISLPRLDVWRRTYHFFGERVRRAADAARSRLAANTGARALVADFFVRHGLSVSMSLRVRELDKCIECYECEKACEQRYGAKRLSLNGKVLGALDFVDCCHTCVDQRCIDPCAYDSIKFDTEKKEVIILEESCIGCSLCALACPYDAIEMHELDDKPLLKLRLEKDNKLAFGDGKPRKARLRRIASKCDHCISYEDQACISACPTGALLEIPPEAAFVERTEQMSDAAKGGFEHTVMFNPNEIFDPKKFYKGLSEEDDKGRAVEQKLNTTWLWVIGILGSLACLGEIALRKLMPEWSGLFYYLTKYQAMEPELALENIEYKPTEALAQWLGYIGTVVMFASMFYSGRKWLPFMRKVGAQRSWFDWHVWAGAIGPVLVLMHTAGKLDNWVSVAVWSMVAALFSGVVGRYISTVVPDLASQASLRVLDLERKMAELRNRHAGVNVADRFYERLRRKYSKVADPGMSGARAGITALWMYTADAIVRPFRSTLLRLRLKGIKDPKARTRVAQVATELALIECRRVLLPKIEPMFREWKIIHIPFAIVLTIVAAIHIVNELFLKR